jgi:hypothetical protein
VAAVGSKVGPLMKRVGLLFFALGALGLAGCRKPTIYETTAAGYGNAQAQAKAAGLAIDPANYECATLPPEKNGAEEIGKATLLWNEMPFRERSPMAIEWGNVINERDLAYKRAQIERSLDQIEPILQLVHQASNKGRCCFTRNFDENHVAKPEYGMMKEISKGLAAKAVYASSRRDFAKVEQCLTDIQSLSKFAASDHMVDGDLLALQISKIGIRAGQRVLGESGVQAGKAVEASVAVMPELHLADCLPLECLASIGNLRHVDPINVPGMYSYNDAAEEAKSKDSSLTNDQIAKAYETRLLEFWTKAIKAAPGKTDEELGDALNKMTSDEAKGDVTHMACVSEPDFWQIATSFRSLQEQKKACLATVALVRGENEAVTLKKHEMKKARNKNGYSVYSATYDPPLQDKNNRGSYEFVYPYKGR